MKNGSSDAQESGSRRVSASRATEIVRLTAISTSYGSSSCGGGRCMERIKRYGLPVLTPYGWEIVGRVLMAIGLLGLVVLQLGAVSP